MSDKSEGDPPALAGEVWRGVDQHAEPIAVARLGHGHFAMWWDRHCGEWTRADSRDYASDIMVAWALAERARAEAAEADRDATLQALRVASQDTNEAGARAEKAAARAAAERALRKADVERLILTAAGVRSDDPVIRKLTRDGNDAEHRLRALGAEP